MNALRMREIGNATRISALLGSAIAAVMFAVAFATEKQLPYQIDSLLRGQNGSPVLAMYLGLILAVFICYGLAGRQKIELLCSLVAIAAVGGIFAWCMFEQNFLPSPFVATLAIPAVLHVYAVKLTPQAAASQSGSEEVGSEPLGRADVALQAEPVAIGSGFDAA